MTAPPYQQPGAEIAFWALFVLFALGEFAMRARSLLNRSGTRAEGWSLLIVVVCLVGGLLGGLGAASWHATAIQQAQWPVFVIGLALMVSGVFVRQWAIVTLGRFFTAEVRVHSEQRVIDRGPYRWVRHPSYSGLIIFLVGFGLSLTNWMSLLILAVVPAGGLVVRIHSEESALLTGVGEPYRRYAATHKRLFPWLW